MHCRRCRLHSPRISLCYTGDISYFIAIGILNRDDTDDRFFAINSRCDFTPRSSGVIARVKPFSCSDVETCTIPVWRVDGLDGCSIKRGAFHLVPDSRLDSLNASIGTDYLSTTVRQDLIVSVQPSLRAGVDKVFIRRKCLYAFTEERAVCNADPGVCSCCVGLNFVNPVICSDIKSFRLRFFFGGGVRNLVLNSRWVNTDSDSLKRLTVDIRQNGFVIKLHQPSAHLSGLPTYLSSGVEKCAAADNQDYHSSDSALIRPFEGKCVPEKSKNISETEP